EPQSFNRYAYVLNNPLRWIDPDGHQGKEPPGGKFKGGVDVCISCAWDDVEAFFREGRRRLLEAQQAIARGFRDLFNLMGQEPLRNDAHYVGLSVKQAIQPNSLEDLISGFHGVGYAMGMVAGGGGARPGRILVSAGGKLVPVPSNWVARVANNGKGLVFQEAGAVGNGNMIRIMDANA